MNKHSTKRAPKVMPPIYFHLNDIRRTKDNHTVG